MPVYCYSTNDGRVFERVFPMGGAPKEIAAGNEVATRDFGAEGASVPPTAGWPMECVASGVNASDAKALEKTLADRGVPTKVSSDGDPIYTSASHRKKALAARGFFDKSAYS